MKLYTISIVTHFVTLLSTCHRVYGEGQDTFMLRNREYHWLPGVVFIVAALTCTAFLVYHNEKREDNLQARVQMLAQIQTAQNAEPDGLTVLEASVSSVRKK